MRGNSRMQASFLEELVAEWYEYKGYLVKRNERGGKRAKGGHEGELDVVAFHPKKKHLVHIETSTDADSWATRKRRFAKKFASGRKYIPLLFPGLTLPESTEKIAIFVFGSTKTHKTVGGGNVQIAEDFILDIVREMKNTPFLTRAVPEKYPILRVVQMITAHGEKVVKVLGKEGA